jgi:hypothetical protein
MMYINQVSCVGDVKPCLLSALGVIIKLCVFLHIRRPLIKLRRFLTSITSEQPSGEGRWAWPRQQPRTALVISGL